jgi:hypothetical protein
MHSLKYGIVVDDIDNRTRHRQDGYTKKWGFFRNIINRLNGVYPVRNIVLDRVITIAIHTAVCALIYRAFDNLPAAMLFAVNVGNNQVSLWLNGKRYGINAILCLLAFIYSPYGALFLLVAPLFQASAITFPIFLAMYNNVFIVALIPLLFLVGNKHLTAWIKSKYSVCKVSEYLVWNNAKIIFMFKTIAYYFIKGLIPFAPTMYPEEFKRFGIIDEETEQAYRFDLQALLGFWLVVATAIGYFYNSQMFIGMVWWLCTIVVFGNLITLTVPLAERYMYLPNVGLMVALSMALSFIHPMAWMAIFLLYVVRLFTFSSMYRDIDSYLKHHCFYYPKNDQSWIFLANKHAKDNDIFGVMHLANSGLLANPKSTLLWLHRATGFIRIQQMKLADQCIEMAKKYAKDRYGEIVSSKITEIESLKGELCMK